MLPKLKFPKIFNKKIYSKSENRIMTKLISVDEYTAKE